jgi:hypothetical protein
MPYVRASVGDLVLVCWLENSRADEVDEVLRALETQRRTSGRAPYFLSTNRDDVSLPPEDVRRAFRDGFDRLMATCAELHVVPRGHALMRAVIRSTVSAILFATRHHRRVVVHDSLSGALARLHAHGVIDAGEATQNLGVAWAPLLEHARF